MIQKPQIEKERIAWTALEYEFREKTAEWFWSLGIVVTSAIVAAIIFHNYLFALLIGIASIVLILYAFRKPGIVSFELNRSGVVINKTLFPYASLESFWVEQNDPHKKLLLKSKKMFMPLVAIPIENLDPEMVREFLRQFLPETELHEPASQKILEHLGI